MSEPDRAREPAADDEDARRFSLRVFGRRHPKTITLAWVLLTAALIAALWSRGGVAVTGGVDGLTPEAHRTDRAALWLLVRLTDGPDEDDEAAREARADVALQLGERLEPLRAPLAPPLTDASTWLDDHVLFLIPPARESELRAALEPAAIDGVIAGLRARLASPLFGVRGEEPRRDPLALQRLLAAHPGQFGFVRPAGVEPTERDPIVTVAGDLLTDDGRALLVRTRGELTPDATLTRARALLGDAAVELAVIGPPVREAWARDAVERDARTLAATALAALALLLSLTLRATRAVLCLLACLVSGALVPLALTPAIGLLDLPLLILLLGFGCEGALHLQRMSVRGWPAAAMLASCLTPLLLTPYPIWRAWSVRWLVGIAAVTFALRVVLPAALRLVRAELSWPGAGFRLRPTPALAALLCAGLFLGGGLSIERLDHQRAAPLPLGQGSIAADEERMAAAFFDPWRVVEAESRGPTPEAALTAAAVSLRGLASALGDAATRIESPGAFVIAEEDATARVALLAALDLPGALAALEGALERHGLRSDAFAEFTGAAARSEPPTPAAALAGPLGPWIAAFVTSDGDEHVVHARVHLRRAPEPGEPGADDSPVSQDMRDELRGPAIAAADDRARFDERLGLTVGFGLWISALVVWLGTRSLAIAVAAAAGALAAQCGLLLLLYALALPVGSYMLPIALLVGASGSIAGGRACRAVDLDRPFVARGLLITSACQIAAGLTLLTGHEPIWRTLGLCLACGSALASGLGMFVAPGLCALLRRLERGGRP